MHFGRAKLERRNNFAPNYVAPYLRRIPYAEKNGELLFSSYSCYNVNFRRLKM